MSKELALNVTVHCFTKRPKSHSPAKLNEFAEFVGCLEGIKRLVAAVF